MGWTKDGERAYRDQDRRLVRHPVTVHMTLTDLKLTMRSEVAWKQDDNAFMPSASVGTRTIEGIAALGNIRIKLLGAEEESDWSSAGVYLRRAETVPAVDLSKKPDIEIQPQCLWFDSGRAGSRSAALLLMLQLPAESFDLLAGQLSHSSPASIALQAQVDLYEEREDFSSLAFGSPVNYLDIGTPAAAMFEKLSISPETTGVPSGARNRLVFLADDLVEDYIKRFCKSNEIKDRGGSQIYFLLRGLCRAAAENEAKEGMSDEVFKNRTFEMLVELVGELRDGVLGHSRKDQKPDEMLNFWRSHRQPFYEVKKDGPPDFDRIAIETAAQRYLDLPYRCQEADRLLIDILTALEMYAYGGTVLQKVPLASLFGYDVDPLHYRPIRSWLIGQAGNLALFGIPIALTWWAAEEHRLGPEPTFWIIAACAGLFLLLLTLSIIGLPFLIWASARAKVQVQNRLNAMLGAYGALQSEGPISARHVIRRLEAATDHDVVWPAPLYALLDDIMGRGGRF